jgi:hypothetical protein
LHFWQHQLFSGLALWSSRGGRISGCQSSCIFGGLSRIDERYTDKVAIAPDQLTSSDGMKVVEREFKIQRHGRQIVDTNAGTYVCYISNSTRSYACLTREAQQSTFDNSGSAYRSALELAIPLIEILKDIGH